MVSWKGMLVRSSESKVSSLFVFLTGSFDPAHEGHIELIKIGINALYPCGFFVFPNSTRPGKVLTPLDVRRKSLNNALRDLPCSVADDDLLSIYEEFGETGLLSHLFKTSPYRRFARIAGMDSVLEAEKQGNLARTLQLGIRQYVVQRPGYEKNELRQLEGVTFLGSTGKKISSSSIRRQYL